MKAINNDNIKEETEISFELEEYSVILASLIEMYINEPWLEDWEIHLRTGATREDLKSIIIDMGKVMDLSPGIADKIISPRHQEFIKSLH